MIENNNNYDEMSQGIDRITAILQRNAQPVVSSPYAPIASGLPVNILNALASSSYDYGDGGSDFITNVQNHQTNQQNQEINQQKNLLSAYEAKLKIGDAKTKALDDRISLFTGNDPEGKALFLQELHNDPEPIDPTNSYQVMTKLAAIKKRIGYESPDLKMSKTKDQLDIDLKRAQIDATKAKIGGESGKPLPVSASNVVLTNRENLDKAKKALALISGQSISSPSGSVTVGDKDATGWKGYLPDAVLQRSDKGGVSTRAAIADIGSMVIHDRSGAAVSASEFPRLMPFIPKNNDDPKVASAKLERFVSEYQSLVDENEEFYRESGYRVPENYDRFSVVTKKESDGFDDLPDASMHKGRSIEDTETNTTYISNGSEWVPQ